MRRWGLLRRWSPIRDFFLKTFCFSLARRRSLSCGIYGQPHFHRSALISWWVCTSGSIGHYRTGCSVASIGEGSILPVSFRYCLNNPVFYGSCYFPLSGVVSRTQNCLQSTMPLNKPEGWSWCRPKCLQEGLHLALVALRVRDFRLSTCFLKSSASCVILGLLFSKSALFEP